MEPNNFERDVQQKLAEFKIPPADDSWTHIEKKIGRKEKDRRVLLLFLLLSLSIAGGYWWINRGVKPVAVTVPVENAVHQKNNRLTPGSNVTSPGGVENNVPEKSTVAKSLNKRSATFPKEVGPAEEKISAKERIPTEESVQNEEDVVTEMKMGKITRSPWLPFVEPKEMASPQTLNTPPSLSLPQKKTSKVRHPWTFGLTLSGGTSWTGNAPAVSYNNLYSSTGPNTGGTYYAATPDPFSSSFSYSAGIFVERSLSPKAALSFGLSYLYFSLQNKVRNDFHFVELPVSFRYRVNPNSKLPISFDAGITAGELAGSNALQYNYSNFTWYHDNNLFNKFRVNVQTGISITLFNKGQYPVSLGPSFFYGLTQLARKGLYAGKKVGILGIRAGILLRKK